MGGVRNTMASELLKVTLTVKTEDGLVVTVDFTKAHEFLDAIRWIERLEVA